MRVLIQFYNEQHWINFRFAELDSLLELNGLKPDDVYVKPTSAQSAAETSLSSSEVTPFLIAELPNREVASAICRRSVLIRYIVELWDHTSSYTELLRNITSCSVCNPLREGADEVAADATSLPSPPASHCHCTVSDSINATLRQHTNAAATGTEAAVALPTWSFGIHGFGQSIPQKKKDSMRAALPFSRMEAAGLRVSLKAPQLEIMLIVDCSVRHKSHSNSAEGSSEKEGAAVGSTLGKVSDSIRSSSNVLAAIEATAAAAAATGSGVMKHDKQKKQKQQKGDNNTSKVAYADVTTEAPCYFGVLLATGGMKEELIKYDLKNRLFIGPTSLDHGLAFIMSNLCLISKERGSVVLDPFVGTASILIAASHSGGTCWGSDIDIRVLKGELYAGGDREKDKDEARDRTEKKTASSSSSAPEAVTAETKRDIVENFKSYGLAVPELVRMDNHMFSQHYHCIASGGASDSSNSSPISSGVLDGFFDAIVTDPPYGIRAGARKSGRKDLAYSVPEHLRYDHCPHTQTYAVEEVMLDLLHTAAITLRCGGVLAYLIPTPYEFDPSKELPMHPCLQMTQACVQHLSCRHGRHCVVMRKYRNLTPELNAEFRRYKAAVLRREDENGFGNLIGRLERALSADALTDEAVVKKISNACMRRKIHKAQKHMTKQQYEAKQQAASGEAESPADADVPAAASEPENSR